MKKKLVVLSMILSAVSPEVIGRTITAKVTKKAKLNGINLFAIILTTFTVPIRFCGT